MRPTRDIAVAAIVTTLVGCAATPPCPHVARPTTPIAKTDYAQCFGDSTHTGTSAVVRYAAAAKRGIRPPDRIIAGPRTALCAPSAIARGPRGELYVLNHAPWYSDVGATTDRVMSWVTVYDSAARGDAVPVRTLHVQPRDLRKPITIGVDRTGHLYVGYGVDPRIDSGNVAVFARGADGDVEPVRVLHGLRNGLRWPGALAVDSRGYLYITNTQRFGRDHAVRVFAPGAAGEAMPCRVIEGPQTGLRRPEGIALDGQDRLYVGNTERSSLADGASITVYPARANGDAAPLSVLSGGNRYDGMGGPELLRLDSRDSLYVRAVATLSVFAPGAHSAMEPARYIWYPPAVKPPRLRGDVAIQEFPPQRSPARASAPRIFALDHQNRMYVVWGDTVKVYAPGFTGSQPPLRRIAGPRTGIYRVSAIAVDDDGWLYLADRDSSVVRVFVPGASGNVAPRRTINGRRTRLMRPGSLAVDAAGQLYVGNGWRSNTEGAIAVYPPGAKGDDRPIRVLAGPATRLEEPHDIEFDGRGNMYVASGSVLVYRAQASGDEPPLRSVGGPVGRRGVTAVALGRADTLYTLSVRSHAGRCDTPRPGDTATVAVYAPDARQKDEPSRTLMLTPDGKSPGRQHSLGLLRGLAVDAAGTMQLWHPEGSTTRSATAAASPVLTIVEEPVPGSEAAGLAVPGDGWIYQTNVPGLRRCPR